MITNGNTVNLIEMDTDKKNEKQVPERKMLHGCKHLVFGIIFVLFGIPHFIGGCYIFHNFGIALSFVIDYIGIFAFYNAILGILLIIGGSMSVATSCNSSFTYLIATKVFGTISFILSFLWDIAILILIVKYNQILVYIAAHRAFWLYLFENVSIGVLLMISLSYVDKDKAYMKKRNRRQPVQFNNI